MDTYIKWNAKEGRMEKEEEEWELKGEEDEEGEVKGEEDEWGR